MSEELDSGPPPGFTREQVTVDEEAVDESTPSGQLFKDKLGRMDRWALSNVVKALPRYLGEGEQLLGLAAPMFEHEMGLLAVTDRQLIFLIQRSHPDEPLEFDRLQLPYESVSSAGMATVVDFAVGTAEREYVLRGKAKQMAEVAAIVEGQLGPGPDPA
jgi:hypothetical protein